MQKYFNWNKKEKRNWELFKIKRIAKSLKLDIYAIDNLAAFVEIYRNVKLNFKN